MYRTSDPNCETRDWVSLNFDSVPHEAIVRIFGESPEDLERLYASRTGTCEACDGLGVNEDQEDCAACEGSGETQESDDESRELYGWPAAHGALWQCEDRPEIVEALLASGFIVYRPDHTFDGLIVGIDGGGYSFWGQHWLPLRARFARASFESWRAQGHGGEDARRFQALSAVLLAEADRESEAPRVRAILEGQK